MTFILDTTIGLGIWVPFTIGKTAALLTVGSCPPSYGMALVDSVGT